MSSWFRGAGRDDVLMQGRGWGQREFLDAESVAGHLLKPGSVHAFLAEYRTALFPDEMFADLFPSGRGRPSVPGDVMAAVIVLQTLHGLSDSEATDAVTFDLRWKAAIGWPVTAKAFHDTTLTYWRRRLAASSDPDRIFHVVQQVIAETGAIRGKTRRALDSTVLDDAVATQDTVTQLIAGIRRAAARSRARPRSSPGSPAPMTTTTPVSRGSPGTTGRPATRWYPRWSATPTGSSLRSLTRTWTRPARRRSPCWRWSPARMSNRPRDQMAPTAGGASPAGSPRSG